jgi:hypothetical protein
VGAALTRRGLLVRSVIATGFAAGASAVGPLVGRALAQPQTTDVGILGFALTLEQLEAAFYADAIEQAGLTGEAARLARLFEPIEDAHVEVIADALEELGADPVEELEYDWGPALQSQSSFLKHAVQIEDIVVAAFNGSAPLLQDKQLLTGAGAIVQSDARQAALLRELHGQSPMVAAFDPTLTEPQAVDALAPYVQG